MLIIRRVLRFCKINVKKLIFFIPSSKAYCSLKKLQRKCPKTAIIVTSYALGDLVYAMAYLKAWRENNPCEKVVLIADPNKKDVVESYADFDDVIYYARNTKAGKNVLIYLPRSRFYSFVGRKRKVYNTIPQQIYGEKLYRDNLDLLRDYLQLPKDSEIVYPKPQKIKITSIPDFEKNKDKIVVINPYSSGNIVCRCTELLDKIVTLLRNKGLIVYSNIVGEQKPLSGTCPLRCGLLEMYSIADEISLVVSVRSGILDWIISTKSKKFVIYTADTSDGFSKMFDLLAWKTCNCKEVHMADTTEAEALNTLEKYISG